MGLRLSSCSGRRRSTSCTRPNLKDRYNEEYADLGRWTKEQLVELGPTFIKLGQIASSRQDIFNEFFVQEPCIRRTTARRFKTTTSSVHRGRTIPMETFTEFDTVPYKAASIGQVHNAVLKNGVDVVVKAQVRE